MSRRAAVLLFLLLVSMAVVLPLVSSMARRDVPSAVSRHVHHHHSRAWWRRHHARLHRRRSASLKRRRELESMRNHNISEPINADEPRMFGPGPARLKAAMPAEGGSFNDPQGVFGLTVPGGWSSRPLMANGEYKFRVSAPEGQPVGTATLSQVSSESTGNSSNTSSFRGQRRMLARVPFNELRRIVINKMIDAGGWVVNDLEREIGGRRVFVVFAQTAASGDGHTLPQTWAFYFTEMEGRIYSFTTNAPVEFADRIAADSEKVLASFHTLRRSNVAETSPQ